jgi:hypothetical protein
MKPLLNLFFFHNPQCPQLTDLPIEEPDGAAMVIG